MVVAKFVAHRLPLVAPILVRPQPYRAPLVDERLETVELQVLQTTTSEPYLRVEVAVVVGHDDGGLFAFDDVDDRLWVAVYQVGAEERLYDGVVLGLELLAASVLIVYPTRVLGLVAVAVR